MILRSPAQSLLPFVVRVPGGPEQNGSMNVDSVRPADRFSIAEPRRGRQELLLSRRDFDFLTGLRGHLEAQVRRPKQMNNSPASIKHESESSPLAPKI